MIVTALLVSHDGARWLPAVLDGIAAQTRRPDHLVGVDTGSRDGSADLVSAAFGAENLHVVGSGTSFPAAVRTGLDRLPGGDDPAGDEWIWILHDDANPDPAALATLVDAARTHPDVDVLGPKLREWPSLRRLLEVGVTISPTGRRETDLEPGEYDQGQHDEVRRVLAVNTAGMLVRRRVLEDLGGFDDLLPVFGNDIDFGWRAARAGHSTLVVPDAVVFHAAAAHTGARRTPLTGKHTHYAERRAALLTLLVNVPKRRLPWQVVRLFFGTLLRMVGLTLVRAPGEALDELAALASVYGRPGVVRRARAARLHGSERGRGPHPAGDGEQLLAGWWVPYRHGLDFLSDLAGAATRGAQDVAERRRAARLAAAPTPVRPRPARRVEADEDELYEDTGWVVRFLTSPVAVLTALGLLLVVVAAREGFGAVSGGALSPVPAGVADWWSLHTTGHHALGTGTDAPAPGYVLPFALAGSLLGGPGTVVTLLMVGSVPLAFWGAWRLLRLVGHVAAAEGLPRAVLLWGAGAYALVPATSGAWGQGRFGVVAAAALLPWLAHAAFGFADPSPGRRWRAAWRTGLLLALVTAFVPVAWVVAVVVSVVLLGGAALVSRGLLRDRDSWLPPVVALVSVPVLLAPWLISLVAGGRARGLLLEAGRLPVSDLSVTGVLTGRLADAGAPWWVGALLGLLAVAALVPRATRVLVAACWAVALAAAVVVAGLSRVDLDLGAAVSAPGLGFFVVLGQAVLVVAVALASATLVARLRHSTGWRRGLVAVPLLVALVVPLAGLGWWLVDADDDLAATSGTVVPAYMAQSSLTGPEHGVLIVRGDVASGLDYRVRRDDGITLGEDEVLALAGQDRDFTRLVRDLTSRPDPARVESLAGHGIEYVLLPEPVDGSVAAVLDATDGLVPASADGRDRAWHVEQPLAAEGLHQGPSAWRVLLLLLQGVAVVAVLVLAGPEWRKDRDA